MPRRKHNPQPSKCQSGEGGEEAEGEKAEEEEVHATTTSIMSSTSASPATMTRAAKRRRTASHDGENTLQGEEKVKGEEGKEAEKSKSVTGAAPVKVGGKATSPKGKSLSDNAVETPDSTSSDGDGKRNLSLEALFQVTHSELQNISRQGGQRAPPARRKSAPSVESGTDEKDKLLIDTYVEDITTGKKVPITVISSGVNMGKSGESEIQTQQEEVPDAPLQIEIQVEEEEGEEMVVDGGEILKLDSEPDAVHQPIHVRFPGMEDQDVKVVYSRKAADQHDTNRVSFITYNQQGKAQKDGTVVEPIMNQPQVGRKRKHPQKPGRHICPYCGRGCAKPSVLQKHIRAHTGERPYPCQPCGFSFKTKSNLYKHCKSRAHAMKAGGATSMEELHSSSMSDESAAKLKPGDSDDSNDLMDQDVESVEGDKNYSEIGAETRQALKSPQPQTMVLLSSEGAEGCQQIIGDNSETQTVQWVDNGGHLVPVMTKVFLTDKQFYDIAQVNKEGVIVQSDEGEGKTYAILQPKQEPDQQAAVSELEKQAVIASVPERKKTDVVTMTSTLQKFSDNSMKVTIQLPKIPGKANTSANLTTCVSPSTTSPVNISKSHSVEKPAKNVLLKSSSVPTLSVPSQPRLLPAPAKTPVSNPSMTSAARLKELDRNAITPEMLNERISMLISANAAIIDMPMADAPRPKRMSRQNSEVSSSASTSTPKLGYMSAPGSLHLESTSVDMGDSHHATIVTTTAASTRPHRPPLLAQAPVVESFDVPAEEDPTQTLVVAAAESEVRDSEVTTEARGFTLPITIVEDGANQTVQIDTQTTRAPLVRSQSMIGQPGVFYGKTDEKVPCTPENPEGSVIKDLLLKGRVAASGTQGAVVAKLDAADAEGCNTVDVHHQIQIIDDGIGHQVAYLVPTSQDHVPLNVAHDVEVLSESPPQSKQLSPASADSPAKNRKFKKAATIDTPFQNMIFESYDPNTPPKRGRPKGSKNRVKETDAISRAHSLGSAGALTTKFTLLRGMSGGELVGSPVSSTSGQSPQPLIGTPQVMYPALTKANSVTSLAVTLPSAPPVMSLSDGVTLVPQGSKSPAISLAPSSNAPLLPMMVQQLSAASTGAGRVLTSSLSLDSPLATPVRPSLRLNIPSPSIGQIAMQPGTPSILSTGSASPALPETPPTSQSLLKLKLKGKLLMRRSMSVERALSQEKERQRAEAAKSGSTSPQTAPINRLVDPLRRCESLDETSPLKKRRLVYQHSVHEETPSMGLSATHTPSPLTLPPGVKRPKLTREPSRLAYPSPIHDLAKNLNLDKKPSPLQNDAIKTNKADEIKKKKVPTATLR